MSVGRGREWEFGTNVGFIGGGRGLGVEVDDWGLRTEFGG